MPPSTEALAFTHRALAEKSGIFTCKYFSLVDFDGIFFLMGINGISSVLNDIFMDSNCVSVPKLEINFHGI